VAGVKQSRVYSECEGDEGRLWGVNHSDEMEKDWRTKNVSKNAKKRHMNFVQMGDANEGAEDWERETVMKDDGSTKTSEDKASVMIGGRVTTKPNTQENPSDLQFLRSRVTSESGSVHLPLRGKPGPKVKGTRTKHHL
jgi:hypothetical protein